MQVISLIALPLPLHLSPQCWCLPSVPIKLQIAINCDIPAKHNDRLVWSRSLGFGLGLCIRGTDPEREFPGTALTQKNPNTSPESNRTRHFLSTHGLPRINNFSPFKNFKFYDLDRGFFCSDAVSLLYRHTSPRAASKAFSRLIFPEIFCISLILFCLVTAGIFHML